MFLFPLLLCRSQIVALEIQVSALKEDLEKEHQRWRNAQANYERQVGFTCAIILLSIMTQFFIVTSIIPTLNFQLYYHSV